MAIDQQEFLRKYQEIQGQAPQPVAPEGRGRLTPEQREQIFNSLSPEKQRKVLQMQDALRQLQSGQAPQPAAPVFSRGPLGEAMRTAKPRGGVGALFGKAKQIVGNIPSSGARVVSDIAKAGAGFFDPRQIAGVEREGGEFSRNPLVATGQALGSLLLGGLSKAGVIPEEPQTKARFEAITQFFKERYGSKEALEKTITEDPAGFAMDVSAVIGGGGAVLKGAGMAGKGVR